MGKSNTIDTDEIDGEKNVTPITFHPGALREAIKEAARKKDVTTSQWLRRIIRKELYGREDKEA